MTSSRKFWTVVVGMTLMVLAPVPARAEGGTVSGKVVFEGQAPAPQPIHFGAERQCALMHGDKMPVNEDLVVNPNGTVRWTLVYVKEGVTGPYTAPDEAVVIDQVGCVFVPHAAAAMKGQKVTFKNSDPVLHNVRDMPKMSKAFNIAQPVQGMTTTKTIDTAETGIQLRCDVHFWMRSYLHVLDHPFYAVTGEDGTFELKGLPPGDYVIEAWHEKLGTRTASVKIEEGKGATADLIFTPA